MIIKNREEYDKAQEKFINLCIVSDIPDAEIEELYDALKVYKAKAMKNLIDGLKDGSIISKPMKPLNDSKGKKKC